MHDAGAPCSLSTPQVYIDMENFAHNGVWRYEHARRPILFVFKD
jgi:hypothetical protein